MRRNTKTGDTPQPMDPSAPETRNPTITHNKRVCYAAKTLVAEVQELFPEMPVDYADYDGRNTALTVSFDLTVLDGDERADAASLFVLVGGDLRVSSATVEEDVAMVSFTSNALTQDSREPFRINETWLILDNEGTSGLGDGSL
jgi:hypothetical protein